MSASRRFASISPRGPLPEPARSYDSVRRYGPEDVGRLRFVRRSQQLGFSLDDVSELLQLEDGTHCDEARTLAELVDRWRAAKGHVKCPLIAGLQVAAESPLSDGIEGSLAAPAAIHDATQAPDLMNGGPGSAWLANKRGDQVAASAAALWRSQCVGGCPILRMNARVKALALP